MIHLRSIFSRETASSPLPADKRVGDVIVEDCSVGVGIYLQEVEETPTVQRADFELLCLSPPIFGRP